MAVIYADLVLGLNFILDATLLAMTARIRGLRLSKLRWAGGVVIGTAYSSLMFLPFIPYMLTLTGKVVISICMLIVAFGYHNLGYLLRNMLVFYFSAFAIAGGAIGFQYLMQDASLWAVFSKGPAGHITEQLKMGAGVLLLALTAAIACYWLAMKQQQTRKQMKSYLVDVEFGIEGKTVSCRGLIDTGNGLKEPLSGAPVVITNVDLWQEILPEHWLTCVRTGSDWNALAALSSHHAEESNDHSVMLVDQARLRLLPYRGVNQGTKWMIGFKPDYIQIIHESHTYVCKHVIVGLDGGQLSHDEQFEAIVHPDLLSDSMLKPEVAAPSTSKAS